MSDNSYNFYYEIFLNKYNIKKDMLYFYDVTNNIIVNCNKQYPMLKLILSALVNESIKSICDNYKLYKINGIYLLGMKDHLSIPIVFLNLLYGRRRLNK